MAVPRSCDQKTTSVLFGLVASAWITIIDSFILNIYILLS
ncbi:hypothetical protein CU024_2287 [Enterococcus faecium]|nr:hypothetical protein [Enterococcus faecium]